MARIVLSVNSAWNVHNFRMGLIRALQDAGHQVCVLAPEDDYASRLISAGCDFHHLAIDSKGTSPISDMALLLAYRRLLKRVRPDVFLGYTAKPNIYGSMACRSLGIPVINNIAGLGTAFIRENWLTTVVSQMYRFALRPSATVFFQNQDDLDLFIKTGMVPADKAALLPGSGIDLTRFKPAASDVSAQAGFRFLYVGRLLWDKGIGELVEATRKVRASHPDVVVELLGPAGSENQTAISAEQVADWQEQGLVLHHGSVDDVRPYLAAANCVVLPSYREGLPRSLLEACAMGKPIIATDVPGCRSLVDEGSNGFLCALRDADDLAAQMLRMIELTPAERERMGRAGRQLAETRFDEKIVLERYKTAISSCIDTGSA